MKARSQKVRRREVAPHVGLPKLGRPLAPIPTLVLDLGVALYMRHGAWGPVLKDIERSGNGTYPRNTLIRRIEQRKAYLDVQNSDPSHY
jgi:hypothetical protein